MNDFNSEDTCGSRHTFLSNVLLKFDVNSLNGTNIVGTTFTICTSSFALKWVPESYIIMFQRLYANGKKSMKNV